MWLEVNLFENGAKIPVLWNTDTNTFMRNINPGCLVETGSMKPIKLTDSYNVLKNKLVNKITEDDLPKESEYKHVPIVTPINIKIGTPKIKLPGELTLTDRERRTQKQRQKRLERREKAKKLADEQPEVKTDEIV